MSDSPFEPCAAADVAAYVRGLEASGRPLKTTIHGSDEMFRFELGAPHRSPEAAAILYFATGHQIFHTIQEILAWRFGDVGGVRAVLDFASGYGRTTRFLVRSIAPERITVVEIDPAAVKFQEETFGVKGAVSKSDPESLRLRETFDVVLASSFFSHLPEARFEPWLRRLYGRVAPGGILIFSVHGMQLLPERDSDRVSGIVFRTSSETLRLDREEYGTSYVTAEFVRAAADRAVDGKSCLLAFPFGLGAFQDVYVLLRPPLPPVLDLRLALFPWGEPDRSAIQDGMVRVEGWAAGFGDERPPDVRLFFRETVAEVSPGEGIHGSRRRWSFSFPVGAVSPDDVVRVEAVTARGLSRILIAATLRPYLPAAPL